MRVPNVIAICVFSVLAIVQQSWVQAQVCGTTCVPAQQTEASTVTFKVTSPGLESYFTAAANSWNTLFANSGSSVRFHHNQTAGAVTISVDDTVCPDWAQHSRQHNYIKGAQTR